MSDPIHLHAHNPVDPTYLHAHMLSTLHTFLHTSCRPYTPACTQSCLPVHFPASYTHRHMHECTRPFSHKILVYTCLHTCTSVDMYVVLVYLVIHMRSDDLGGRCTTLHGTLRCSSASSRSWTRLGYCRCVCEWFGVYLITFARA